jgi:O-antigen/teichoic acid export membrane protein
MPLILVPYISRTIGIERYGITEFSVEIAMFFGAVLLFGYDFTMSKKLSQNRYDKNFVNALFWNVFYSRILLSSILFPAFALMGIFFLSDLFTLEILGYCSLFVASRIFSSWWFFQGLERIKWIAWGNLLAKIILLIFVLSLVREKEDYPLVVLGYAVSQFSVNLLSWIILIKQEELKSIQLRIKEVFSLINSSIYVFLNEFSIMGFTALNLLLVKEYLSPKDLGIYVSAMKVVVISQNLIIRSLSKSLFPNLSLAYVKNPENFRLKLRQFRNYLGGFLLILAIAILLLRSEIVFLLYGPGFKEVSSYLTYIAFLPFFMGMTNIYGWQGLYVVEKAKTMVIISLIIGLTSLILLFVAIPRFGVSGVLVVRNIHEFLLMGATALFFNRLWKKEVN